MALNMPLKWICLQHKTVKVIIKIMQKNFFSVQKCWHSKTLSHTTILKLLWETHFLSQISLFYVLFIKVENNDACKNQKPDYARDDMVPIILLKPQNKKLRTTLSTGILRGRLEMTFYFYKMLIIFHRKNAFSSFPIRI